METLAEHADNDHGFVAPLIAVDVFQPSRHRSVAACGTMARRTPGVFVAEGANYGRTTREGTAVIDRWGEPKVGFYNSTT